MKTKQRTRLMALRAKTIAFREVINGVIKEDRDLDNQDIQELEDNLYVMNDIVDSLRYED